MALLVLLVEEPLLLSHLSLIVLSVDKSAITLGVVRSEAVPAVRLHLKLQQARGKRDTAANAQCEKVADMAASASHCITGMARATSMPPVRSRIKSEQPFSVSVAW